jgi:hypothetical protein
MRICQQQICPSHKKQKHDFLGNTLSSCVMVLNDFKKEKEKKSCFFFAGNYDIILSWLGDQKIMIDEFILPSYKRTVFHSPFYFLSLEKV